MTSGASGSYEYDASGNPTKVAGTTYSYDNGEQLKEGGGAKFTFDNMGQRTKSTPASGPATTYGYDQAGNLISVKRPEEGAVSKIEDSYVYDGTGLRASETINGATNQLAWNTAESLPLLLYDGTRYYLYGPEGQPFEQIASETPTYLHHDQQGSTRLLTNSEGKAIGKYTYTPYGAVEKHEETATTPLGYDGQYTSSDTGLIYLRARVYDPSTAQFMSVDPIVSRTEAPYFYAGDSPVTGGDPSGLCQKKQPNPPLPPWKQKLCDAMKTSLGTAKGIAGELNQKANAAKAAYDKSISDWQKVYVALQKATGAEKKKLQADLDALDATGKERQTAYFSAASDHLAAAIAASNIQQAMDDLGCPKP